uniref:nucleotidyl transferase AbiEii/AbiGii toxin family protein n=1 Tax=Verminephrobacter aporrectodeae TaxID=1110389 RepID=UPI0022446585|nr:nucleotidyl transferase AbiEii/AbiGii toxin family protein [Verminephrobacter aporrectodeae]
MSTWDKRYTDRVQLLVDILPVLAREPRFALKGGTAINLFEHDLPRLSVDIDLAWLPVHDFAEDAVQIAAALEQLANLLRARPMQLQVQISAGEGTRTVTRLVASRGRARVQIETTPVMRGTVHPVRNMVVRPRVEEAFGFACAQVLDFADLYAGKLAAALSRQHPRDLFDIDPLLPGPAPNATQAPEGAGAERARQSGQATGWVVNHSLASSRKTAAPRYALIRRPRSLPR